MRYDTTNTSGIEDQIRAFIIEAYLTPAQAETFRDDDDLLRMLDSLQILRLVIHLESAFGIKVDNSELAPENLGSVAKLADLVRRKRREAPGE
jgi:acyl carrier protein